MAAQRHPPARQARPPRSLQSQPSRGGDPRRRERRTVTDGPQLRRPRQACIRRRIRVPRCRLVRSDGPARALSDRLDRLQMQRNPRIAGLLREAAEGESGPKRRSDNPQVPLGNRRAGARMVAPRAWEPGRQRLTAPVVVPASVRVRSSVLKRFLHLHGSHGHCRHRRGAEVIPTSSAGAGNASTGESDAVARRCVEVADFQGRIGGTRDATSSGPRWPAAT